MRHRLIVTFPTFLILGLLMQARVAQSAFISGTITGSVTSAGTSVPGVAVGSLVIGSYTYDSSTIILNSFNAPINPFTSFSLSIGTNPRVFGLADLDNSVFTAGREVRGVAPTQTILDFFFQIEVINAYVGANVTLQSIDYSTNRNPAQSYTVSSDSSHSFTFSFGVTPSTTVPEPSAGVLLGFGCLILAARGVYRARRIISRRTDQT